MKSKIQEFFSTMIFWVRKGDRENDGNEEGKSRNIL